MTQAELPRAVAVLKRLVKKWQVPVVGVYAESNDPYVVLVSCILSLRTRDAVTYAASERLFARAPDVRSLSRLRVPRLQALIYPVSFYRVKARGLRLLARQLLERHGGRVPDTLEELLALQGVGRKTANLVLTLGHRKPGVCVDTHVHRISNRWGYVSTRHPDETELALRAKLPKRYWMIYNDLLVPFGQHHCTPISPFCSTCPLRAWCDRRGVTTSR